MTKTIENYLDLAGEFESVVEQFHNISYAPILVALSPKLEELHAFYFSTESDPSGKRWAPLSPVTIKKKGHARILWETSALEKSLMSVTSDSVRDIVSEGDQEWLIWGTSIEYAMFHQQPGPTSKLPQRRHVGVNEEFVDDLVLEVADQTIKELSEHGIFETV